MDPNLEGNIEAAKEALDEEAQMNEMSKERKIGTLKMVINTQSKFYNRFKAKIDLDLKMQCLKIKYSYLERLIKVHSNYCS